MFSLQSLKDNPEKRKQVLAAHDLFAQLDGNPFSIKTLASFYKNPNVANNNLLGLYKRLVEEDDPSEQDGNE